MGRTLGGKRRERVDNNQELIGLGAANLASSLSGAFPVTGGFSRSVVIFDARSGYSDGEHPGSGTHRPGRALPYPIALQFTEGDTGRNHHRCGDFTHRFLSNQENLAFSRSDWSAVMITLIVTLLAGVESGVSCGVLLSLGLHLVRTAKPHIAEVGLVEGSEHFRNVRRFKVSTVAEVLSLRIDESLFFANAVVLEELIFRQVLRMIESRM